MISSTENRHNSIAIQGAHDTKQGGGRLAEKSSREAGDRAKKAGRREGLSREKGDVNRGRRREISFEQGEGDGK